MYRLLNLETKKVVFSRDVQWLEQNYQTFMKSQGFEDDNHEEDTQKTVKTQMRSWLDEVMVLTHWLMNQI